MVHLGTDNFHNDSETWREDRDVQSPLLIREAVGEGNPGWSPAHPQEWNGRAWDAQGMGRALLLFLERLVRGVLSLLSYLGTRVTGAKLTGLQGSVSAPACALPHGRLGPVLGAVQPEPATQPLWASGSQL